MDYIITGLQVTGRPWVALHPCRFDAAIAAKRNLHTVTPIDNFQTSICRCHLIDSYQNGEMLDVFDVGVGVGVNVGVKAACKVLDNSPLGHVHARIRLTTPSKFIVDLFLEEKHLFTRKLLQHADRPFSTQETVEAGMGVCKVLCATQHTVTFPIYLLIWHPWDVWSSGQIMHLLGPLLKCPGLGLREEAAHQQVSILLKALELFRYQSVMEVVHGNCLVPQ